MADLLLHNLIPCGQPDFLQRSDTITDFLPVVSVLHGKRLPWTIFCAPSHAFVSRIVYTRGYSFRGPPVSTEKLPDTCGSFDHCAPTPFGTICRVRCSIRLRHAAKGRAPAGSRGSPKIDWRSPGKNRCMSPAVLFLSRNPRGQAAEKRKSDGSATGSWRKC